MKPNLQRGFAIITAIFILVVLALLGAFAMRISTMQQISYAQDLQSARVLQAARTGLEWGAYMITVNSPQTCSASTSNSVPATATSMAGITVTVNCDASLAPLYKLTSTACNRPSGNACPNTTNPSSTYIERQVEMSLQYPP